MISSGRLVPILLALCAVACWSGSLVLLLATNLRSDTIGFLAPQRWLLVILVVVGSLLTFTPIQRSMEISRLVVRGTGGITLLVYTLAFVPPPTGNILSLPDVPVYCLLVIAVFWSLVASSMPFVYALRQRIVKQRIHRLDVSLAWRQSYEIGVLAAGCIVLAGLRVLTWISFLLVLLIVITFELLVLPRQARQRKKA
jgi:hypothetical protein